MPSPYGIAIFCEDVRQEIEGKNSYMGVFGASINLRGSKPAILPKLAVVAHVNIPSSLHKPHVKIVVLRVQNDEIMEEISSVEGDLETPESRVIRDDIFTQLVAVNMSMPFRVEDDCVLDVRAFVNGDELMLGTIPVNFVGE